MARSLSTVVETEPYLRKAHALGLSVKERERIVDEVAADLGVGDEVIAGHVWKRRVAAAGRGKRGGYRIAVAYFGPGRPAYLLAILSKGQASVFTAEQKAKAAIRQVSEAIAASFGRPGS